MSFRNAVTRSSPAGTSTLRKIGAAAASAALLVGTVIAPLSLTQAFALDSQGAHSKFETQKLTLGNTEQPDLHSVSAEAIEAVPEGVSANAAELSLSDFMFRGVVNWGGYRFTYYSQQVLPGGGLKIDGRHVNAGGYVSDGDGYIVLAGSAPMGTVYETPFGYKGKIYDRGTTGNHLDVYIR